MLATGGVRRSVPRYAAIYREHAEARSFFLLVQGTVQLSRREWTEKEDNVELCTPAGQVDKTNPSAAPLPLTRAPSLSRSTPAGGPGGQVLRTREP